MNEEIKPLVFPLTRKGITYLLESETEHTRTVRATFPGATDWLEVFEKRINAAREIQGVKIPASEAFPGDEAFGKWAWTFPTESQCQAKAAELDAKVTARIAFKQAQASLEAPNDTAPVPTSHPATGEA
jgi:hypothetical protein